MLTDPQIQIEDIDCPNSRREVKLRLEDLIRLCPSDSAVVARVQRMHDRFWAEIRVATGTVCMHALVQAGALSDVLKTLEQNMLTQILDWRAHRFA